VKTDTQIYTKANTAAITIHNATAFYWTPLLQSW